MTGTNRPSRAELPWTSALDWRPTRRR